MINLPPCLVEGVVFVLIPPPVMVDRALTVPQAVDHPVIEVVLALLDVDQAGVDLTGPRIVVLVQTKTEVALEIQQATNIGQVSHQPPVTAGLLAHGSLVQEIRVTGIHLHLLPPPHLIRNLFKRSVAQQGSIK